MSISATFFGKEKKGKEISLSDNLFSLLCVWAKGKKDAVIITTSHIDHVVNMSKKKDPDELKVLLNALTTSYSFAVDPDKEKKIDWSKVG